MSRTRFKLSDRFLSTILSVMIVFTMIPIASLQALATDDKTFTITVDDGENPIKGATVTIMGDKECQGFIMEDKTDNNGVVTFFTQNMVDKLSEVTDEETVTLYYTVTTPGYTSVPAILVEDVSTTEGVSGNIPVTIPPVPTDIATVSVNLTEKAYIKLSCTDYAVEEENENQSSITVEQGKFVSIDITIPSDEYYIKTVSIDNKEQGFSDKRKSYSNVIQANKDVEIKVTVVRDFTVTTNANEGGTIKLNNSKVSEIIKEDGRKESSQKIEENSEVSVGVEANDGYYISSVKIGGVIQSFDSNTVFNGKFTLTGNTEIRVEFVKVYTFTIKSSANGTVVTTPPDADGSVTVITGTEVKIIADPDDNYRVAQVNVNGEIVDTEKTNKNYGPNDKYEKLLTANKDYTVDIVFALNRYNVTAIPTENGTITPAQALVNWGESCDIAVAPAEGYSISSVKLDGANVQIYTAENGSVKFTIPEITADKTIEATFVKTETAKLNIRDLFNDEEAVNSNEMTFVYAKDGKAVFTTDKDGIILYDKNGKIIGGGKENKNVPLEITGENTTIEIGKIELVYQAENEFIAMPHVLEGVSASSPLRIIVDKAKPSKKLEVEAPHKNDFYNRDFTVKLKTADLKTFKEIENFDDFNDFKDFDDSSGIASVEYFITSTVALGKYKNYDEVPDSAKTQSGPLYTHTDKVENSREESILVNALKNDSDTVVVWVKITDKAGNVSTDHTEELKVCATAPKLTGLVITGEKADNAEYGYYKETRIATITIEDRESAFDEEAARKGIEITAKKENGEDADNIPLTMISDWSSKGKTHVVTIEFSAAANYTWSFNYTNKAGLALNRDDVDETEESIYKFTVDGDSPEATISIDKVSFWDELLSALTFGIWKKEPIKAEVTATDEIAGIQEIVYYKDNVATAPAEATDSAKVAPLTKEKLDELYEANKFVKEPYSVDADEMFVVYARISDKSGNIVYISTDGLIYDSSKSNICLYVKPEKAEMPVEAETPEATERPTIYNKDVTVVVKVKEDEEDKGAYSGIKTIDYKIVVNNDYDHPTKSGNLYTFDIENPEFEELEKEFATEIIVNAKENNSDNVKVVVTTTDNAGNPETNELPIFINVDEIKAEITLDGKANRVVKNNVDGVVSERGYYNMAERVATIVVTDRKSAFDEEKAKDGIIIENDKGERINTEGMLGEWVSNGDKHTMKVHFKAGENYKWRFEYTNYANNTLLDKNVTINADKTPYEFTVDNVNPTGKITIGEDTWDKLLETLTFGIWHSKKVNVKADYSDKTSPAFAEYYKVINDDIIKDKKKNSALDANALNELYANGEFESVDKLSDVEKNEHFVIYLRITDYAGNYTYICSNGVIVDTLPSEISIKLQEPYTNDKDNSKPIYGKGYENGIEASITVTDPKPSSGIKSVDYKVIKDDDFAHPTQKGNLYTFEAEHLYQDELKSFWQGTVTIDPKKNNSSNVALYVTVVDNAGKDHTESVSLDIDITQPQIEISYKDTKEVTQVVGDRGYFAGARTATIKITERANHFDSNKVTVNIKAVNSEKKSIGDISTIDKWTTTTGETPDKAVHTATIVFDKDANYEWLSISCTDIAGNKNLDPVKKGVTPFKFTVDRKAPEGTLTATRADGKVFEWESLKTGVIDYGIWTNKNISITGEYSDETSTSIHKVEYYKVSATSGSDVTKALTVEQLGKIKTWSDFKGLKLDKDERCIVYLRITDLAGNVKYISTNGLIIDHTAPREEAIAPEITFTTKHPENVIYNSDVKVDLKVVDPMVNGTYSGIKKVWYEVRNMGQVTQGGIDKPLFEFGKDTPNQNQLYQNWTGSIIVDSKLNNSNNVEIIVYAQDNALNSSENITAIKIDITKPEINISYNNNSADTGIYFKNDRVATVVVTERNFNPDDVVKRFTYKDGVEPVVSDFTKINNGTGNLDNTQWSATIKYAVDGDYTFDIAYTDLANNVCDGAIYAEGTVAPKLFTIDKTLPVVSVSYDNNNAKNGNYYNAFRTATVVITEHNFISDRVKIINTATDDGVVIVNPTVSGWSSVGDRHTATIQYKKDAKYTFDITVKDKVGNDSADYKQDTFVIDTTKPKLTITGIADNSANNGDVIPVVSYSDTNYDAENTTITLTGANRKAVQLDGVYTDIHNGRTFTFKNFEKKKEVDDIYTLNASLTDRAGNTSTEKISFSVNRFGSTYDMSDSTDKLNGTYVTDPEDVVITEVNANELKNIKVTLFKNNQTIVLKENEDYILKVEGGNGEWYRYTYTILKKNFADDGVYRVVFHSEDSTGNVAENTLDTKDTEISFGVDVTKPNIVVANLESGVTYALEQMTVKMSVSDNLLLGTVTVYLDDYNKAYKSWTAEEVAEIIAKNGEFTFDISGASTNAHKVKIVAVDAAGNEQTEEITDFYVTTDIWVQFFNNKPLFFGIIAGIILLSALIVFIVVYKRKKKENR